MDLIAGARIINHKGTPISYWCFDIKFWVRNIFGIQKFQRQLLSPQIFLKQRISILAILIRTCSLEKYIWNSTVSTPTFTFGKFLQHKIEFENMSSDMFTRKCLSQSNIKKVVSSSLSFHLHNFASPSLSSLRSLRTCHRLVCGLP